MVAVQMGQQQRGDVRGADADRGRAHQHAAAAVDQERLPARPDQGRRPARLASTIGLPVPSRVTSIMASCLPDQDRARWSIARIGSDMVDGRFR